ncbi:MAG: DNA polymerase III subunit delta' [Sphingomonadaceae bacterium]
MIGQEAQRAAFGQAASAGRLHHAWLLAGQRGMGKRGFADWAAQLLLGEDAAALIRAGSHPDLRVLEPDLEGRATRTIAVEDVRALAPMLRGHPAMGQRRVVILDAADDLNRQAANALLKLLEEPGPGTCFLLVSHAPGRLLPTIRSRCRTLRFPPLADATIDRLLAGEQQDMPEERRKTLVRLARGSPGEALRLAQGPAVALLDALAAQHPERLAQGLQAAAQAEQFQLLCDLAPRLLADAARQAPSPALVELQAEMASLAASAVPLALDRAPVAFTLARALATARSAT